MFCCFYVSKVTKALPLRIGNLPISAFKDSCVRACLYQSKGTAWLGTSRMATYAIREVEYLLDSLEIRLEAWLGLIDALFLLHAVQ